MPKAPARAPGTASCAVRSATMLAVAAVAACSGGNTAPPPVASVTISPDAPTISVAQSLQLTATLKDAEGNVLTGRTVTWTSGTTSVATVDGTGLVTGVSMGTSLGTAASEGRSATVTVTVVAPVVSVVVAADSASVEEGKKVQLTATLKDANGNVLSGRVITWTTSAPANATVDGSGLVTAIMRGQATITATSEGKSDTAAVTILPVLLPPGRVTTWNPGLNAVGGIPQRTTIFKTIAPSGDTTGVTDFNVIQSAINTCPAGQVVKLTAGDFYLSDTLQIAYDPNSRVNRSNITVRGAGPGTPGTGAGGTRIHAAVKLTAFTIGSGGIGDTYYADTQDLTADGAKGSFSVTVASNPGYAVGELVTIDQVRPSYSWFAPGHSPAEAGGLALFCRTPKLNGPGRTVGQVVEIAAINGATLTFSTPLHVDYPLANQPQVSRHNKGFGLPFSTPLQFSGIEDMYIEGPNGGGGGFFITAAKYCWAKNVELNHWVGGAVLQRTFRSEIRDSYIHTTRDPNPGGGGYALSMNWYAADNLLENNITWGANKVIVAQSSGGGNVVGYNYFEDGFGANYTNIPEVGMNASHYPTPHMELFEGNESWDAESDSVWGNSVNITFFRNHMTGRRRGVATGYLDVNGVLQPISPPISDNGIRHAAGTGIYSKWFNFVGNVLGTANDPLSPQITAVYEKPATSAATMCDSSVYAVWMLGWGDASPQANCGVVQPGQADTAASTLRHGNFDYVTNTIVWDPENTNHTLPDSLYLTSKPAFFGANPWPWVTPESTTKLATLPARARFDAAH